MKTFAQAAADLAGRAGQRLGGRQAGDHRREDGEPVVVVPLSVWNALAEEERAAEALDEAIA